MKLYHQTGSRYTWNFESLANDNAGDGLIFSPVNIESEKIFKIDTITKNKSFFDPQFYLIKEQKGKMHTYDYFPSNIKDDFNTTDFCKESTEIAQKCIDFQLMNNFSYIVIPARYYDEFPSKYYEQFYENLIFPFISYCKANRINKKILLTIILKQNKVVEQEDRDNLLNWITSIQDIHGIYLIFQKNSTSKQIKDPNFLCSAMQFIHYLKLNNLEVHIGYNNTEGLLYSLANPDSISMGLMKILEILTLNDLLSLKKLFKNLLEQDYTWRNYFNGLIMDT